ncbi:MAG: type II toxin-antitoxin system RelE/ParE family toxin [Gemmatimonadota bacterium]|nr:type II toxin-antitoxin system RelE/ParE family toxin [Gemmatimonadota bacterium]MDE2870922.1 type II toxin-antitoxin system RelE/ParE family toxin [Gemmatimonadota bacterium]
MAAYEVEISRTAEKQLRALPRGEQGRILRRILALADDPLPRGSRKLGGYEDVYRIRVGRYRILYSVAGRELVIIILKIGHRREVYR